MNWNQGLNTPGFKGIILSSFVLGISFGGYIPLQSLWLESIGRTFSEIGITNGIVGLGIVISAYFLSRLGIRKGATNLIIAGLISAAIMAILFRLSDNMPLWLTIKFISGIALGTHWVLSEAWLLKITPLELRSRAIAIYATSMSLGFALGPALIWKFGSASFWPFVFVALALVLGAMPFFFMKKYEPELELNIAQSPIKLIAKHPTVVVACIVAGGVDLAMLSLLPALAARSHNASAELVILLVPAMALGTIFFQYPAAKLAEKFGARPISAYFAVSGTFFCALVPFCFNSTPAAVSLAFIGAGLVYGLYTLGLTMLSMRIKPSEIVAANAGFVIVFEISNLVGPTMAGWMADLSRNYGFSLFVCSLGILFLFTYMLRLNSRRN